MIMELAKYYRVLFIEDKVPLQQHFEVLDDSINEMAAS